MPWEERELKAELKVQAREYNDRLAERKSGNQKKRLQRIFFFSFIYLKLVTSAKRGV